MKKSSLVATLKKQVKEIREELKFKQEEVESLITEAEDEEYYWDSAKRNTRKYEDYEEEEFIEEEYEDEAYDYEDDNSEE
jgi:hypothetical protein